MEIATAARRYGSQRSIEYDNNSRLPTNRYYIQDYLQSLLATDSTSAWLQIYHIRV